GQILLKELDGGQPAKWLESAGGGIALDAKGQLLAIDGKTAQLVRINPNTREVAALSERRFNGPRRLAPDSKGGVWFTDGPGAEKNSVGAICYISAHGSVTRFPVSFSQPSGLGLSPNGKVLYVASATTPEVWSYPVESAGSLGKGTPFRKTAKTS